MWRFSWLMGLLVLGAMATAVADDASALADQIKRGTELHAKGNYRDALIAWEKAVALKAPPSAAYNAACAAARAGMKDKALEWLGKAIDAGFTGATAAASDEDLVSLRGDMQFVELMAMAETIAYPCKNDARFRALDFWVGEWDVTTPQGQPAGKSSVQSILGACVVFENWTSPGMSGKSFNVFNVNAGSWRQSWVDDKGKLLEFTGEMKNGVMIYLAPDKQQGKAVVRRMTFTPIDARTVHQVGEDSFDDGKTWAPSYDLLYHRK